MFPGQAQVTGMLCLLLVLAGFLIYWPASDAPFVLDSFHQIGNNQKIQDWSSGDWIYGRRIVANFTLALDHAIYGNSPSGFLFTNILIHIASAMALFWLVRGTMTWGLKVSEQPRQDVDRKRKSKSSPTPTRDESLAIHLPWLATFIWFVHPLQTQSVIYHVQRMESLMGLLMLLALLCLNRFIRCSNLSWLILAVLSALASMATKEVGFITPLLMLLYYYVVQSDDQLTKQRWILWVLGIVLLFGGAVGGGMLWSGNAMGEIGFDSRIQKSLYYLATQSLVVLFYLRLAVFPFGQNLDHGFPYVESLTQALVPAIFLIGVLAFGGYLVYRKKIAGFLIVTFFLVLAPTSSVLPVSDIAVEHRMYIPLACFVLLMFGGLIRWLPVSRSVMVVMAALVVILAVVSYQRCQVYRNEVVLWSDSAAQAVHSPRPLSELGRALAGSGKHEQAVEAFEAALALTANPTAKLDYQLKAENEVALRLAKLYAATGQTAKIPELLQQWFDGDEYYYQYVDAALLYFDSGDLERAEPMFERALEAAKQPQEKAFVLVEQGFTRLNSGKAKSGRSLLENAVRLDEENWKAHNNLGIAIMTTDQDTELAQKHFTRAVELSGANPEAVANLNRILMINRSRRN